MFGRYLAICALLAVTLTGCTGLGGQTATTFNYKGSAAKVAAVINNLSTYATDHEDSKICNQVLSAALAQRLASAGSSCETIIGDQITNVDDFTVAITAVKVSGDSAAATVVSKRDGKNATDTVYLALAPDGSWRIVSLD